MEWLGAAGGGRVRNRSGDPYKPSALRGYEQALRRECYDSWLRPGAASSLPLVSR
jgi:hypothetical protein